jgi:hypothetical protein
LAALIVEMRRLRHITHQIIDESFDVNHGRVAPMGLKHFLFRGGLAAVVGAVAL